ncbi:MAG: PQQ-like beta-propeller repeat protein, partial [Rhodospirillales bacterium]|nr:PQQ-like beta-propeller repeat protein [Rhodospirillales bacterium]
YMVADSGFLTCLDPNTGDNVWRQRLREKFAASPVYADGKIYLFGEFGTTFVIAPGREYKLLAENKLEDGGLASPAVVGKTLFLRTKTHVYAIEEGAGVAKGL